MSTYEPNTSAFYVLNGETLDLTNIQAMTWFNTDSHGLKVKVRTTHGTNYTRVIRDRPEFNKLYKAWKDFQGMYTFITPSDYECLEVQERTGDRVVFPWISVRELHFRDNTLILVFEDSATKQFSATREQGEQVLDAFRNYLTSDPS